MTFESLGVNEKIVRALKDCGIVEPTLIQEKAIPLAKSGADVVGMSKTGSGKTAAFGVPLLERVVRGQGLQALVLVPTRELAVQVGQELVKFGKYVGCSVATVFGGVSLDPQVERMARADIVVATPGRMRDHVERGNVDFSRLKCFVLDEADKMVEMGFIEDVTFILEAAPEGRQMLLFGATIAGEIKGLKNRFMRDPQVAQAELQVKEDLLEQYYYNVESYEKFSLLVHLLKNVDRAIVFCSKRSTVELVAKNLRRHSVRAEMIHGRLSQNKRLRMMELFNRAKIDVLVASSVAARGLDVKDLSHVFNYDLSQDPQEYIHRVGRTARAGESGKAITLLSSRDHDVFRDILHKYPVTVKELPKGEFPRIGFDAGMSSRRPHFGNGQRHSWGRPQGRR